MLDAGCYVQKQTQSRVEKDAPEHVSHGQGRGRDARGVHQALDQEDSGALFQFSHQKLGAHPTHSQICVRSPRLLRRREQVEQTTVALDAVVPDGSQAISRATSSEMERFVGCVSGLPCA
eukprot:6614246-Pyramimonas_sp.AAC.1